MASTLGYAVRQARLSCKPPCTSSIVAAAFCQTSSLNRLSLRPAFSTLSPRLGSKPLPPRIVIRDEDITESFLKGSGPGGQKINKTNSSVQLIHAPTGIVVKCQSTRSRAQNRNLARKLLQDRIEEAQLGEEARTNKKRAAEGKKKDRAARKRKAKYRALEDGRAGQVGADGDEDEDAEYTVDDGSPDDVAVDTGKLAWDDGGHARQDGKRTQEENAVQQEATGPSAQIGAKDDPSTTIPEKG